MNEMPLTPPSLPSQPSQPQQNGLSIASLVLGIMSFVCFFGILTGIPAIITGHIARGRARRHPMTYGGAGMALAGLILGYVSLAMVPITAALLLPALAKAKSRAQTVNCVSNLKQIALGARMWSADHNDTFPPNFSSMSNQLISPMILVCNGDSTKTKAQSWSTFDEKANVTYEFLMPNAKDDGNGQGILFRCPIHGTAAYSDGSVRQTKR